MKLAHALLEKEVLFQSDVEALIGKRPFEEKKSLSVEETAAYTKDETIPVAGKENEAKNDGTMGGLDFSPSV